MKRVLACLCLLIFSSCSVVDIDFHMPVSRFDTPETTGGDIPDGDLHFSGSAGIGTSHKVTLSEAYEEFVFGSTAVNTETTIEKSPYLQARGHFGLLKRLDTYLRAGLDSPLIFGLKFQFLGEPTSERKEGWKMAVSAGYGNSEQDEDKVELKNSDGTVSRTYTSNLKITAYELGLHVGKRVNKRWLVYMTAAYNAYDTNSRLTSSQFDDFTTEGYGRTYGGLTGFKVDLTKDYNIFVQAEIGMMEARYENTVKEIEMNGGVSMGVQL